MKIKGGSLCPPFNPIRGTIESYTDMKTHDIYRNMILAALVAAVWALLPSCGIRDDLDDCGIYLEFIYDHNMDYADLFSTEVPTVDVLVFDASGRYLFTKHALREDLIDGKRMFLGTELSPGDYKILTIGGLTDSFRVTDTRGDALSPGLTALADVRITLVRGPGDVAHEFPALWVGPAMDVKYKADLSTWPVYLIKDTNRFHLLLSLHDGGEPSRAAAVVAPYTFGIVTPEGAVYAADNSAQLNESVTYTPHYLAPGEGPGELSTALINTVRLFRGTNLNYRLFIRDTRTQKIVWDYDLMTLLWRTKPASRPDGSALPMQEYLDRRSEWRITILYKDIVGDDGFVAIAVSVNGWIIWLNDIEI